MGMTDSEMDAHDRLTSIIGTLGNLPSTNVVLVGDIMMDRYIHGFADNLNTRAPVPVLKETRREEAVGAAAHVARGLVSLGFKPCLFGVVGDDTAGVSVLEYLNEEGVNTDTISIVEGRTTTVKTRLLATRQNLVRDEQLMLRWDIEADEPMPGPALDAMYDLACEQVEGAAAVILSDYGQGVVTDEGAVRLIERANAAGVPVIADPKLTGFHRTQGVAWVVMQSQGLELMRRRLGADNPAQAAHGLLEEHGWGHLLVLEGSTGVTIYGQEGEDAHVDCTLTELKQMIGLIDAAAVAITAAVATGMDVQATALMANAASECILGADRTDRFVLTRDDLIERMRETAWNLQISKR